MAEEPAEIRRGRGQALIDLAREDLELYGVGELEERIEALQAEIARSRAQMQRKQAGRAAADALFSKRD
ncbi:DUF1192 domain-containing protein [Caulobacter sp. KR2-114]|uniref:DUF1192 domain-containing protein n=1 Tax=Caulobacter sp. KR2-114 TaxID=3400912 RepID=UPI003C07B8F8